VEQAFMSDSKSVIGTTSTGERGKMRIIIRAADLTGEIMLWRQGLHENP
jgi:hypothetical protein